jgi:hypothetical protein
MLESDVHAIPEHVDIPKRICCEMLTGPNDFAIIVTEEDPEAGEFVEVTLEIKAAHATAAGTQKEKAAEKTLI